FMVPLGCPRVCNIIGMDKLFSIPFFGPYLAFVGALPIRRQSADLGAIKTAIRLLRDGRMIMMFPEGTRTKLGALNKMHEGFILLARKTNASIIPFSVDGNYEAWPSSQPLPMPLRQVRVRYHQPIRPAEYAA